MRVPSYRLHKPTGQAVVTIRGRDHYLGKFDSPESREKYRGLIATYVATGYAPVTGNVTTVRQAVDRFWFGRELAPKDRHHFKQVLRPVMSLFGDTPLTDFGPVRFRTVRAEFVAAGWCRDHVNRQAGRVKEWLRWLVAEELYPADKLAAVRAVAGVRPGEAPDHPDVPPVADEVVAATLPHVPPPVAGLVQFQRWSGCRPGEAVIARGGDIDTDGRVLLSGGRKLTLPGVWVYVPAAHKGGHLDKAKHVLIGPKGQEVLRPFLDRDPDAYLFSPLLQNRNPHAGPRYKVGSYAQAVARACRAAWPLPAELERGRVTAPGRKRYRLESVADWRARLGDRWAEVLAWRSAHHWHPHQLRHSCATELAEQFGQEVAREVLGHADLDTTSIYAERAIKKAAAAIREAG